MVAGVFHAIVFCTMWQERKRREEREAERLKDEKREQDKLTTHKGYIASIDRLSAAIEKAATPPAAGIGAAAAPVAVPVPAASAVPLSASTLVASLAALSPEEREKIGQLFFKK